MSAKRKVKILRTGDQRSVNIPREFELSGQFAAISRTGGLLTIEAEQKKGLLAVLATLRPLDEDIDPVSDQLPEPVVL